jgi:DNA polymerase-4
MYIREDIFRQTGRQPPGVAPNKFLAKSCVRLNKPNGLFVIKPSQVASFIQDLPLKKFQE